MESNAAPDRECINRGIAGDINIGSKARREVALVVVLEKTFVNVEDDLLVSCGNYGVRIEDAGLLCDAYYGIVVSSRFFAASCDG